MKKFAVFVVLLALCGFVFSQPMMQISNYSIIPSDIYPGTYGYAQIMLQNAGDQTANSVTAHYNYGLNGESTDSIGDLSAGGTASILVPFEIYQQGGTIQVLNIDIFYVSSTTTDQSSKKSSISIPLSVKQYFPLEVRMSSDARKTVSAGESVELDLLITNNGGVMDNLIISMPENSSFSIQGVSQKNLGNVPPNTTIKVPLVLISSSDAKIGTYGIPVVFSYQDASNQPTEQTLRVGPISVLDSSNEYGLTLVPMEPVEIGSNVAFNLSLHNSGSSPISGIVDMNSTSVFTPIGMQQVHFDSVPAGATASKTVWLGVSSSAGSGFYSLPLKLTSANGNSALFNAGIQVSATPEITVTLDSASGTPEVQVANTGNSQIRSVYVSVKPEGAQSATESFIGTLNVDDFASVALGTTYTGRNVEVKIRFRDSDNQEQSVTKTLQPMGNSSFVQQGNRSSNGAPGNLSNRQNNPLSMLLGPAGRNSSSTGPDIITVAIAAAVVIAIAGIGVYLVFFRNKKSKSPKGGSPNERS
jgi:hypothetical protein